MRASKPAQYTPCITCGGAWSNGRYHHKKGCEVDMLIDRHAVAYGWYVSVTIRRGADKTESDRAYQHLQKARTALDEAIAARCE